MQTPVPELEPQSASGTARLVNGQKRRGSDALAAAVLADEFPDGGRANQEAFRQRAYGIAEDLVPKERFYFSDRLGYDTEAWKAAVADEAQFLMLAARTTSPDDLRSLMASRKAENDVVPELSAEEVSGGELQFDEYGDVMPELQSESRAERAQEVPHLEAEPVSDEPKIFAGMADDARRRALESKNIRVVEAVDDAALAKAGADPEMLGSMTLKRAKNSIVTALKNLCGFKNYSNQDVEVEFKFSRDGGFKESFNKQLNRGGNTRDFAKMAASLDGITQNAVLVEAHADVYEGTERENAALKQADVLLSAYRDGDRIVPVELLVKEYTDRNTGKLYMAVTLKKAETEIAASAEAQKAVPRYPAPSVSTTVSVADLVKKINANEGDFLKYIPDAMLTEEQRTGKYAALERQNERVAGFALSAKSQGEKVENTLPEHAVGATNNTHYDRETETDIDDIVDSQTESIRAAARDAGADAELEADMAEHTHTMRGIAEADKAAKAILRKHRATTVAQKLVDKANKGSWNADDVTLAWHTVQKLTRQVTANDPKLDEPLLVDGKDSGMTVREELAVRLNALSTAFADQNTKAGQYMGYLGNKTKEVNAGNVLREVNKVLNGGEEHAEGKKKRKSGVPKKQLTPQQAVEVTQLATEMEGLDRNSRAFAQKKDRIVEILAEAMGPTSWKESVASFSYVSMLSNILKTGGKNVIGNASSGALYRLKNGVVKPVLEKAMQATGVADKVGYTRTTAAHAGKDVRSEAYQVYVNEAYGLVNGPSKYDTTGAINLEKSGNSVKDLTAAAKTARKRYAGKLGVVGDTVQALADTESAVYNAQDELGLVGTAELLERLPGTSKLAQAMKAAAEKNAQRGKTGLGGTQANFVDALARAMQANGVKTAAELDAQPELKEKLIGYAVKQAQEATFHDDNVVSDKVRAFSNLTGVVGRGIMPFAKTPANVAVRAVEYSPFGALVAAGKGRKGDVTGAVDALAKSLTGTALMALGYFGGSLGLLVGNDGDERKDKYEQTTKGVQDYALDIGALLRDMGVETDFDATVTLDTLSPAVLPMLVGASLYGDGDGEMDVGGALLSVLDPMMDMTFLSGFADLIYDIQSASDPDQAIGNIALSVLTGVASQYIPSAAKQLGRSGQKYRQSYYSDKETVQGRLVDQAVKGMVSWIPYLGDDATIDYVDQWGRKQENAGGSLVGRAAYNLLSPAYYAQGESTPLDAELEGLYYDLLDAGATESEASVVYPTPGIYSGDYQVKANGEERRLTMDEMEAFAQVKGQTSYALVEQLMNDAAYDTLTAEEKAKLVSSLYSFAKVHGYDETVDGYAMQSEYAKPESLYEQFGTKGVVDYYLTKQGANADGNSSLSTAELVPYLEKQDYTAEEKAALFGQLSSVSGRGTESVRAAYGESGVYDLYSAKYYADQAGDRSGTVTGEEAQAYLDRQAFQKAYKAALFAAMCPNVKKNPYE